ncbi:MAG: hypothetical protein ACI9OJ_002594 [Myxococcota bacterium]
MTDPSRPIDTVELSGTAALSYAQRAARLAGDRRISRSFVPARELRSVFDSLIPGPNEPRQTIRLSVATGLPVLEELLRARARSRAADDEHTIERFRVDARLRKTVGRDSVLKIIVDRFDPAADVFVRATLELISHRSSEVSVSGDRATLSGALRDTLFRYAGAEPELLYLRLTGVDDVTVNEVTVGQTGPLMTDFTLVPDVLQPAVAAGFILQCRQTRVGPDVSKAARKDPFATSLSDRLGESDYANLRAAFPSEYQVFQDTFFVVEQPATAAVKAVLPGCMVHSVSPPRSSLTSE